MPRTSAASAELTELTFPAAPMSAPPSLTPEQQRYWTDLVGAFPASRFGPDQVPALMELCCAMARSRQVNEQLDELRELNLNAPGAAGDKRRKMFGQLAKLARAESAQIATLSTKLRLCDQSKTRKDAAEARHRALPAGPRPWDGADLSRPWDVPPLKSDDQN
jgi:hypothetical protein